MKKYSRGQSMFELLIAVFVIAISLTAVVGLVVRTVGNTTFSKERTEAGKQTQEAVEWLRAERDNDWAIFATRGSASGRNYCLQNLSWNSSCAPIPGTSFEREATLYYDAAANPDLVEARVVTSWSDSSGLHESRVSTSFTNWRTR
jgi:Tfp pilus assembly protein PilV